MNPSNDLSVAKGPHAFVTRKDGTRGYEPVAASKPETVTTVSEDVTDDKSEATKEKSWGKNTTSAAAAKNAAK